MTRMDSTIARVITSNGRYATEAMCMRMSHEIRVHVGLWSYHKAFEIFREDFDTRIRPNGRELKPFSEREQVLELAKRRYLDDN